MCRNDAYPYSALAAEIHVNWKKVVDPCQSLVFLGVEISSVDMQLKFPSDKLQALNHELLSFAGRKSK